MLLQQVEVAVAGLHRFRVLCSTGPNFTVLAINKLLRPGALWWAHSFIVPRLCGEPQLLEAQYQAIQESSAVELLHHNTRPENSRLAFSHGQPTCGTYCRSMNAKQRLYIAPRWVG